MSKKQLKELKRVLPALTPEQVDAFDAYYAKQPEDAFKTFDKKEDFEAYKKDIVSEATKDLQATIDGYTAKEKEAKLNNIMNKLNVDDKQKTMLSKLTDLSEIKEDDEEAVLSAYKETMKEYSQAFGKETKTDTNAEKQITSSSSDIFGEAPIKENIDTPKSDIFE